MLIPAGAPVPRPHDRPQGRCRLVPVASAFAASAPTWAYSQAWSQLGPAASGARRVAARPRHHRGAPVKPDADGDRDGRRRMGDVLFALATPFTLVIRATDSQISSLVC